MEHILVAIGAWFIITSFIMETENIQSAIFFKVIPFFNGLYLLFYFLVIKGFIKF